MKKFLTHLVAIKVSALFLVITLVLCVSIPVYAYQIDSKVSSAKSLAHYTMGVIYDLKGLTRHAIQEYEQSVYFQDNEFAAHLRLGANYARVGKTDEAIRELTKATALNSEDLQANYLLALIYSTNKDFMSAANQYEIILERNGDDDPSSLDIYSYLGQLYYSQGLLEKAAVQFEKILELHPGEAEIIYLLGSLYVEVDRREDAIKMFEQGLDIDPNHDGCMNSVAYLYADADEKLDRAHELIVKALEIDPDNGAYLDTFGWVLFKQNDFQQSLDVLLKADKYLQDPVIYEHIADVHFAMNRQEEGVKYLHKALDLNPEMTHIRARLKSLEPQLETKTD